MEMMIITTMLISTDIIYFSVAVEDLIYINTDIRCRQPLLMTAIARLSYSNSGARVSLIDRMPQKIIVK